MLHCECTELYEPLQAIKKTQSVCSNSAGFAREINIFARERKKMKTFFPPTPSFFHHHVPLGQGWAINFSKGPHEKLGRLQRAVGRVYGGGGGVFLPGGNHSKQSSAAPDVETCSSYLIN